MQRRHSVRHLFWRGGVAAVAQAMMVSGFYPLVPHALRVVQRAPVGARSSPTAPPERTAFGARSSPTAPPERTAFGARSALVEWAMAIAASAVRPAGFLPLPGARTRGPRPVVLLHGYAMNRAYFMPLAMRLRRAGLGPVFGFEYWTLGRIAAGARQLGWFVDEVRERTGASEVDLIGHSMGGVVARYYVTLAGGDSIVRNLVTLGSPHHGTDVSSMGIGHPTRELVLGSTLITRLAAAAPPAHTRTTVIWSRADALVPGARQRPLPHAEVLLFDDLGHVALLGSRRVARAIVERLAG